MAVSKNYTVSVKGVDGLNTLGMIEAYSDDVEQWVYVGLEDKNQDEYLSLPLTIDEASDLIDALNLAIQDARNNRP